MKHIVLCTFRGDLTAAELDGVIGGFAALRSLDVVKHLEFGENVSPEGLDDGFTHCFQLDFESAVQRDAYLVDPTHLAFVDILKPALQRILVVDYAPTTS